MSEHLFDVSKAKLDEARREVREQLIAAQMHEWPNSRIMTAGEVLNEWLEPDDFPAFVEWKADKFNALWVQGESEPQQRIWYDRDMQQRRSNYYRQLLGALGCILANDEEVVFYECGVPDEKGKRFRGARFGVEGSEYASGFPGGKL
jgi:hypothetical protein